MPFDRLIYAVLAVFMVLVFVGALFHVGPFVP